MKIYTKTGDRGTTSLFGGERVDKNSLRIRAYGEVDELNSLIGVVIADLRHSRLVYPSGRTFWVNPEWNRRDRESRTLDSRPSVLSGSTVLSSPSKDSGSKDFRGNDRVVIDIHKKLLRIQNELFVLGADLATPYDVKVKIPRVTKSFITRLEKEIDKWSKSLPQLKNFILPGGGKTGSKLHCARTVARRAERSIVDLSIGEKVNKTALIYINRLSDWLFVLARYINQLQGVKEVPWKGRSKI